MRDTKCFLQTPLDVPYEEKLSVISCSNSISIIQWIYFVFRVGFLKSTDDIFMCRQNIKKRDTFSFYEAKKVSYHIFMVTAVLKSFLDWLTRKDDQTNKDSGTPRKKTSPKELAILIIAPFLFRIVQLYRFKNSNFHFLWYVSRFFF